MIQKQACSCNEKRINHALIRQQETELFLNGKQRVTLSKTITNPKAIRFNGY